MSEDGRSKEDSLSSDSECTEGEIQDLNEWLKKTPPKVASTLRRIARSKSFELAHPKLKEMASPFKDTETPVLQPPGDGSVSGAEPNQDQKTETKPPAEPQPKATANDEQGDAVSVADQTSTDGTDGKKKKNEEESDGETEEERKLEKFIEDKIKELPQEDRPEVTLVFDVEGRTPTHEDDKLHVIPPNQAHEGQQNNQFYGKGPFAKDTKIWFSWPHSDPGKPVQVGFITCEKPFMVKEVGEDCYTIESTSGTHDEANRSYYDRCLYPASRLYFHHEKNRMAVTARGRPRVVNPKNWDGLPNVKELPRGTIVVRNGSCFKLLSHIEHCSAVFAQLCHEDGRVIGGAADADILHYDTDFKTPTGDVKELMLASIAKAEIQKTKTSAILGRILRAEGQKRKRRKPFQREAFSSDTRSAMKSEASHSTQFLMPEDQVSRERKEAAFSGRHGPSSVASSQSTTESSKAAQESSKAAQELSDKMAALRSKENECLKLENEALRGEVDDMKRGFGEMMSTLYELQKEKDVRLTEAATLSREQALSKQFPVEAAMLEHFKLQKELADQEKAQLIKQHAELQRALEMQRQYVVDMRQKMKEEVAAHHSRAAEHPETPVLQAIARDEKLKGTAREMFEGRSKMAKLEEMLRNTTNRCVEAGIEVPQEVLDTIEEGNQPSTSTEPHVPTAVHFADDNESPLDMEQGEAELGDIAVDEEARKADEELIEDEPSKEEEKNRSPRTGIRVVEGDDEFYYDQAGNAYQSADVLKVNGGLNIVTYPTKPKIVPKSVILEAKLSKKDDRIQSAIESVVGGSPSQASSTRDEARRELFPTENATEEPKEDEPLETYDIERFQTATPESAQHCTLFPSPIDSMVEQKLTNEDFVSQNQYNDRLEKSERLEAMSIAKHEEKKDHIRRVAEAEIAAVEGTRAMEQAQKAASLRSRLPPFVIPNIPDPDVQALRDLDEQLAAERAKIREKEKKAEDVRARDRERKAEDRRRRKEEKERLEAEAEAQRARDFETELRRKQQEEHEEKEKRRKEKEERRRMREFELSGDRSVAQLQREHERGQRERKRKAELDRDAEIAGLRAKYRRLLDEKKKSPTQSEGSGEGSKDKHPDEYGSDDDLKKKAKKERKPLPLEVERLLKAKRAELQSLKEKSSPSSTGRAGPEASTVKHRFRGNKIPESGYVAQKLDPPFEVARKPGKTEDKTAFLNPHEANWRWNWTEFNQIPLKVVQRKSLETNQVNINEFQAMQLAAGFVNANMHRMENFTTKDQAYQELRQAIDAVQAMAEGNMRQVRAVIANRDLRDAVVQAALMTNVPNGFDYRLVALKQLLHVRNGVINKFHYDAKREAKAAGGGGAQGGGGAGAGGGGTPSAHSSDSGAD